MSRLRIANRKGDADWRDDGPAPQPARITGGSYVVSAVGIAEMRPVLRGGGNSITGAGRPKAQPMHVVEKAR